MKGILKNTSGIILRGRVALISKPLPLMGHIGFGIIDRGYNVLQIRVSSLCYLSCVFCSVNAGRRSPRVLEFMVDDPSWLSEWVKWAISFKGKTHLLFDAAGEPLTNPKLPDFIEAVSKIRDVLSITVETRLYPHDKNMIDRLIEAGVNRFNISIDSMDPVLAKRLAGTDLYDVNKVIELVEYIHSHKNVGVHLTPVWIPGVNDREIEKIILWAKERGFGDKGPSLGIQKYVIHKHGRKIPGVKEWSWTEFYKKLSTLEKKYGVRLILEPRDYDMERAGRIPIPYKKGDIIKASILIPGWLRGEYIALPQKRDRVVTIISRRTEYEQGEIVPAKIVHDKDGILLAKPL